MRPLLRSNGGVTCGPGTTPRCATAAGRIEPEAAWPQNSIHADFVAHRWAGGDGGRYVAVVNCSDHQGQCRLKLPFPELRGRRERLADLLGIEVYDRDGGELVGPGLFIDHAPWQVNLFELHPE